MGTCWNISEEEWIQFSSFHKNEEWIKQMKDYAWVSSREIRLAFLEFRLKCSKATFEKKRGKVKEAVDKLRNAADDFENAANKVEEAADELQNAADELQNAVKMLDEESRCQFDKV
jgi:predicted ribosome quality control (RQC) complex YloA/Tae2 family protein